MTRMAFWDGTVLFLLSTLLVASAAENTPMPTLLTNPGFEQFTADGKLPLGWTLGPGATVEKVGAAEGSYCLKLSTPRAGSAAVATLRGVSTVPGKYYRLVYKVRGGEGSAETTGFQRFMVFASWEPAVKNGVQQQQIQQLSGRTFQDTFASWQERTLEFFAPNVPSASMVINCFIEGPGTAYFDDFRMAEAPPPVKPAFRLTIERPCYRNTIFADAPVAAIRGVAAVDAAEVASLEIVLGLVNATPVFSRTFKVKNGRVEFTIPARKLQAGAYRLQARGLTADGKNVSEQTVSVLKVPAAPHTVQVREDNVFLMDGQPFFPIGLWQIAETAGKYDDKQLYELNRAGINTFLMGAEPPFMQQRLDQAAQYHLKPMFNMWGYVLARMQLDAKGSPTAADQRAWEATVDKAVAAAGSHPALFGYFFTDEPLWSGFPLAPIRATYDYFRHADPYHPVYINEAPRNTPEAVAGCAAASDLFGLDIYAVPEGGGHSDLDDRSLACVGKYTDRMREAVNDRKPVVMTLQGFAWAHLSDKDAPGLYPTFEQSRFMAYDAVLHGAKGIMYWGTQYIQEPSFWQTLFRTTSELRDLSAVFTGVPGKPGQVVVANTNIVFLHKVCAENHFIVAVNESKADVKAAFQTRLSRKSLRVVFEQRTVDVTQGAFTDVFAPQAVHVYASTDQLPPPLVALAQVPDPGGEPSYLTALRQRRAMLPYAGNASWIWYPGKSQKPNSRAVFRRAFVLPAAATNAILTVTADDAYVCYLNGKEVGKTAFGWSIADRYNVTALLHEGTNSLAIAANDAGFPPCGLLVEITGKTVSGAPIAVTTDAAWRCGETEVPGWTDTVFNVDAWTPVEVLGPYGSGAWGKSVLYMP